MTTSLTLTPINGEPRIRDLDLADRLGFERPAKIRDLIKRNEEKLKRFSVIPTVGRRVDLGDGASREVQEFWLNQQQATFICMKSETDNAFEVQVEIVRVFDAYLSGAQAQPAPALNPANWSRMQLIELAMQAEQERLQLEVQNHALEAHVATIQPKADALDLIATRADGSLNVTMAAKTLQTQPKALFKWLAAHEWIYRRAGGKSWVAYQNRLQQGVLEHKVTTVQREDGTDKVVEQVLVTAKGLAKLAAIFQPTMDLGDAA